MARFNDPTSTSSEEPDSAGLKKVAFHLVQDEEGYPPVTVETVWAKRIGENLYELDNTPFFATGVAWKDIVRVRQAEDGELLFEDVVESSGHSTMRVIISDVTKTPSIKEHLAALGCTWEQSHIEGLIAVDVPPTTDLRRVRDFLRQGRAEDLWDYEEACLAQQE